MEDGMEIPYDPAIPLLHIYPEKTKTEKDTCIPLFTAALFKKDRTWKQPRCHSTDEWVKKLWYINTMEYQPYKGMHWVHPNEGNEPRTYLSV